jgi:hypothetical protein
MGVAGLHFILFLGGRERERGEREREKRERELAKSPQIVGVTFVQLDPHPNTTIISPKLSVLGGVAL